MISEEKRRFLRGFRRLSEDVPKISEGCPTTIRGVAEDFRRCPDDFPRGSEDDPKISRGVPEDVPRGPRGVLGRRRLFGAFGEKQGTSWKGQECRGAPLPVQGGWTIVWLFFLILFCGLLLLFFMQIFFRLSDWSICTTWYKMLLSDWLCHGLPPYTTYLQ